MKSLKFIEELKEEIKFCLDCKYSDFDSSDNKPRCLNPILNSTYLNYLISNTINRKDSLWV